MPTCEESAKNRSFYRGMVCDTCKEQEERNENNP